MKNWTVRQRIIASFSVVVAILLALSATIYVRIASIEQAVDSIYRSAVPGMEQAGGVRVAWADHLLETQRFLMVDSSGAQDSASLDKAELERLRVIDQRLDDAWASYQATITTEQDHRASLSFTEKREHYSKLHAQFITLLEQHRLADAQSFSEEQLVPAWLEGRQAVTRLIELNRDLTYESVREVMSSLGTTKLSLGLAFACVLVVALLSGLLLVRAINQPIQLIVETLKELGKGDLSISLDLQRRDEFNAIAEGFNSMVNELKALVAQAQRSAVQMTTSVTEIAASSKQQQATASETAATTTEIGATSREISATARDLVQTMHEVSDTAEQASVLASSGQLGLGRMEEVMQQLSGAAEVVNAKLTVLNEKAGNINQVVTTIVKVADQTNLLSLNAAIEAEKAGEYGRGFSVVATQVRRLADQTAVATYDIEQMVREIQSAVSAGVMGMDKFSEEVRRGNGEMTQVGDQLSQIIHQVQALAPRVQVVNEGMQAQAIGAEQINQALVQLGEASTQTVESLRQTGAAIDELNQVSSSLRTGVSRFRV